MSKYCYTCRLYCSGPAFFCTQCGGSFDIKYCPKLHANPVSAVYCHACGTSELSMPHRRPKRGMVGAVALLVVIMSVVGTVLAVVLNPLMQDEGVAPWEIVGGAALVGLAVVAWTFFKGRG